MNSMFDTSLALKIIGFYAILDLALLAILYTLSLDLFIALFLSSWFGIVVAVIGLLFILYSLFSTLERDDYEYVGNGKTARRIKPVQLSKEQKDQMRTKGLTMIITSIIPITLPWIVILITSTLNQNPQQTFLS
jgi:hypothetical protein